MFLKTQDDIELERLLTEQKETFEKSFQENYAAQQATLNIFQKSIEHCDFNKFSDNRTIWNFASYVSIISFDLKTVGEHLFFTRNEWGKRYFARQSALLVYEALNDIPNLAGKDFREIIGKFSNSEVLLLELKQCLKLINEYKRVYFDRLKEIRHNCVGHRDEDSIKQITIIISLSWSQAIEFTTKFDNVLTNFGKFLQKIINISLDESKELKK